MANILKQKHASGCGTFVIEQSLDIHLVSIVFKDGEYVFTQRCNSCKFVIFCHFIAYPSFSCDVNVS